MSNSCAIWGTRTVLASSAPSGSNMQYDSPGAGGRYEITATAATTVSNLDDRQKACLTSWLMDQRRLGALEPTITSEDVSRAAIATPKGCLRAVMAYFRPYSIRFRPWEMPTNMTPRSSVSLARQCLKIRTGRQNCTWWPLPSLSPSMR